MAISISNKHIPVMLKEVLDSAQPVLTSTTEKTLRYFDGTLGRGGHLEALIQQHPNLTAVAMDQDIQAIQECELKFVDWIQNKKLKLIHADFKSFDAQEQGLFDFMLLDLGVSSPQLDQPIRGFSFYGDGPLDMRMNNTQGPTAADLINGFTEQELIGLFQKMGEISSPYRVVRAIVNDRKEKPYTTTLELASLIERVDGWRRKGYHPATQYFMALRMQVNNEIGDLDTALKQLMLGLKPRGRLAVLTFHSLEDRIVKNVFKNSTELGRPVNKKVIHPSREEEVQNPRARSAKLRIFERE